MAQAKDTDKKGLTIVLKDAKGKEVIFTVDDVVELCSSLEKITSQQKTDMKKCVEIAHKMCEERKKEQGLDYDFEMLNEMVLSSYAVCKHCRQNGGSYAIVDDKGVTCWTLP
jgi:predicted nucleic acid-binding protein